ncbi:MAG: 3-dehydroquinate synthase [Gemmatimonadales bacterium]
MTHATRGARQVQLGTYRVTVHAGALDRLGDIIADAAPAYRYAVITDEIVAPLYAERVRALLAPHGDVIMVAIPSGETSKTREMWAYVTDDLLDNGFGRDSTVVALGGGVVGDLAGFVAATYMRGLPLVQVPTSLLAMIDASIGGKTGVDTRAGKNLVGAFHQPAAVVVDPAVLATLPPEHLRAGFAEAIKHGVIADAAYFERVAACAVDLDSLDPAGDAMLDVVAGSIEIKADIVRRDEREAGVRKTLNFGHTIGHAIERCAGYALRHGDCVALGMVAESAIAERIGVAVEGTAARVLDAVRTAGLPHARPRTMTVDEILTATRRDKKNRADRTEYALPARIGAMAAAEHGWSLSVDDAIVHDVLT